MAISDQQLFVTGGTGFIGAYLLRHLLDRGYTRIRALRRAGSDLRLVAEFAEQIEWVESDLLDPLHLEDCMRGADTVIHAAAMVSFNPKDREQMRLVNVQGTANVVNSCLALGIKRLVYVSSVAAIGRRKGLGEIDESTTWERSSHNSQYAISKYQAEMEVWRGWAEGLQVAIANPSIVLGAGFWEQGTARFFKNAWNNFPFYTTGSSGFVDVRDVARFLVLLLESDVNGERFILNAANRSYKELFYQIADALGKRRPPIKVNALIRELAWRFEWLRTRFGSNPVVTKETARNAMRHWAYDGRKAQKYFDFEYIPFETTIQQTCQQFKEEAREGTHPLLLQIHY